MAITPQAVREHRRNISKVKRGSLDNLIRAIEDDILCPRLGGWYGTTYRFFLPSGGFNEEEEIILLKHFAEAGWEAMTENGGYRGDSRALLLHDPDEVIRLETEPGPRPRPLPVFDADELTRLANAAFDSVADEGEMKHLRPILEKVAEYVRHLGAKAAEVPSPK
jgi:hypothetical protein